MYTAFHNLTKKPFTMTADPAFLFVTRQHREALVGLTYAVLDRKGFLVLSGMAGSGKTTLLAWMLQRLACADIRSSIILNPVLTPDEFLELMMMDFGITEIPGSKAQRLWRLEKFLLAGAAEGKVNVLIVDEAHKLSYELLEEIRLLGNLECGEEKLLQILLLGQGELDDLLSRPELWQLKQRVSVRLTIGSLAPNEVEPYIQHRWTVAGGGQHPFTEEAIEHIARWSQGIPRLINAICDNALVEAFADETRIVQVRHVDTAAADLRLIEKHGASPKAETEAADHPVAAPAGTAAKTHSAVAAAQTAAVPSHSAPAAVNGTAAAVAVNGVEAEPQVPRRRSLLFRWAGKFGLNGHGEH